MQQQHLPQVGETMKTRCLCLSVSKRNQKVIDTIDDYSLEWGLDRAPTIFRIAREYDAIVKKNAIRGGNEEYIN